MKVKWKQFAQRRKINLEMFKNMSYVEYCNWCNFRKVEPVSQEAYEGVQRIVEPISVVNETPATEVTTVSTHVFDESQLKKLKKQALLKLCKEHNLNADVRSTRKTIIELILSLNNIV